MASRVLLISTNRCAIPDAVFPLGLAHLAAALRHAGHITRWYDVLADSQPLEDVVREFQPDIAGISIRNIDDVLIRKRQTYFNELNGICERVRAVRPCPVVIGGSGFSIFPRELFELSTADYGICGAADGSLAELVNALASGQDPRAVPGLVWRKDGGVCENPPAAAHASPLLAIEDRPRNIVDHYLRHGSMLNVQTQRGCAFRCCYCTYPVIEGRNHLRQSPEQVAEEFAQAAQLGAKYVFIVDSVFNSSARHVTEICEAILRRNVKIAWGCFLRPHGLAPELVQLMARAGLAHIEFGSDSLSDKVLDAYQKGFTFGDILESSEMARKASVDYCHFLIAGGPGETWDTLEQGFQNSRQLQGAILMAVVGMRIYPGTHLYQQALTEGKITTETPLLEPFYYLAPGLETEAVFGRLAEFSRRLPSWIPGDPAPAYARLVERLRQRGVAGPLWGYFSMIQRLWPQGLPSHHAPAPTPAA